MEGEGRRVVRWGGVVSMGDGWDHIVGDGAVGALAAAQRLLLAETK